MDNDAEYHGIMAWMAMKTLSKFISNIYDVCARHCASQTREGSIIISFSQMRKLRLRDVKNLAWGQTARKRSSRKPAFKNQTDP